MFVSSHFIVISILLAGCVKESSGACDVGFWGEDCKRTCAEGCYFNNGCDEDTGICSRCIYGFYGPHCDSKCSENCVQCNKETGLCISCEPSWFGDLCTKPCNSSCDYCDISNGKCKSCKHGYWGTNCEKECLSDDVCLFKCETGLNSSVCQYACKCVNCQKDTGICYQCAAGFWGHGCYRRCPQNCSYCHAYDGRCYSCDHGYWGYECQYRCPETCIACSSSRYCTICKKGYWGQSCEQRCSHCESCNSHYGYCTECRHGYWGSSCNYKCPDDCSCCDSNSSACLENECQPKDAIKLEGIDTEPEQFTTLTITGIAMIAIGFVLSVISVTLALVIIRRMQCNQRNNVKNVYEDAQHQAGCQNDLELYDSPNF